MPEPRAETESEPGINGGSELGYPEAGKAGVGLISRQEQGWVQGRV